jgi:hypothetical protein
MGKIYTGMRPTMELLEDRQLMATFVVTSTADQGAGTLRQAILDANKTTAPDTINFDVGEGEKTIAPQTGLPYIKQPLTLDATTQPGFSDQPIIELSGEKITKQQDGLRIDAPQVTVKGLIINQFTGSGIFLFNNTGTNTIQDNWIGLDETGTKAAPNKGHGILVQGPNNLIKDNAIAGNSQAGVFVYTSKATSTKITGNKVGTDANGNKPVPNKNGIQVNGGDYTTIGGSTTQARNVVSGNKYDGILLISGDSTHNTVEGNLVGLNAQGTAKVPNGWYGIEVSGPDNVIKNNVSSGNGKDGIAFYLSSGIRNKCDGNLVGTDITGTKAMGNTGAGIVVTDNASNNLIGTQQKNIVAANGWHGIGLYNNADNNQIKNNWVGIDKNGKSMPNAQTPILLSSNSTGNLVQANKVVNKPGLFQIFNVGNLPNTITNNTLFGPVPQGNKVINLV